MELVNTLFASLAGTAPFTGVDITIANCKSAYWDEGVVQQLINQALDEGEKFVGADGLEGLLRYNVTLNIGLTSAMYGRDFPSIPPPLAVFVPVVLTLDLTPISVMYQMFNVI